MVHIQEETQTFLQVVGIASLGGVVNYLRHPKGNGFRPAELACSIIIAAFAGMEAHFIVAWMGLGVQAQFAAAGMAGYGGGVILDALLVALKRRIRKHFDTEPPSRTGKAEE